MPPNSFDVTRIPTSGPGDVSGLMALIDKGALEPFVHSGRSGQDRRQRRGERFHP